VSDGSLAGFPSTDGIYPVPQIFRVSVFEYFGNDILLDGFDCGFYFFLDFLVVLN
jgi:hypothetical protein